MRIVWMVWLSALLAACATEPPALTPDLLAAEAPFGPPSEVIDEAKIFALDDAMRGYLQDIIAISAHADTRQQALIAALYRRGALKLDYDASRTRNAAETFHARSGNCLSLVIMTAAFAKALGLPVSYQSAYYEETWSRSGDFLLRAGHVNVTLGRRLIDAGTRRDLGDMTVDFLPAQDIRGLRTRPITEDTVIAMYLNNRAAEALTQGQLDDAFAWARAAIRRDPRFLGSYNTLGVVYLRHGAPGQAARVFETVLAREPRNTPAMGNLAETLSRLGRIDEAATLRAELKRLEPYPPFYFYELGREAMRRDDFVAARGWFAKEVDRADYYHEFHYWLGLASYKLGDVDEARKQLALAAQTSGTAEERDRYTGKLAALRAYAARSP